MSAVFDDSILMCGNGAGFESVECMAGIYKAFEESGTIPGKVLSSSGSTLFSSLYYSKGIDWVYNLMDGSKPSDFVHIDVLSTAKTALSMSNCIFNNDAVYELLKENMTGQASMRVTTSVTRNSDWSSHMRKVTPGWALAATSIPYIFKPVQIGSELWSDGGLLNNLPVPPINEISNWKHIYIFAAPATVYSDGNFLITQLINLLNAIMSREIEQLQELGVFKLSNVTLIQPEQSYGGGLLNWSPDFKLREETYNLTKELLQSK